MTSFRSNVCHAAKKPYENAGRDSRRRCPVKDGNGVVCGTGAKGGKYAVWLVTAGGIAGFLY
nr:hypothetical protein [Enterocloster clostridioformis]